MKRVQILLMFLQVPLDALALFLAAVGAFAIRAHPSVATLRPVLYRFSLGEFLQAALPVCLLWLAIYALYGLYTPESNRRLMADTLRLFVASLTALSVVAIAALFTQTIFDSRFLVAATWVLGVVFTSISHGLLRLLRLWLYRRGVGTHRVVLLGVSRQGKMLEQIFSTRLHLGYRVVGTFLQFPDPASLQALAPDELVFVGTGAKSADAYKAIAYANQYHLVFKYIADVFDTFNVNMVIHPVAGIPLVELRKTPLEGWGRVAKRLFDIAGALCGIVLFSPLSLVATIGILLETGRPIIYRNERVGIRGQKFFTLKFRSMYQKDSTGAQFGEAGKAAEVREASLIATHNARTGPIYKIQNDPRVTPFGRLLRRTSIDELPQFWNVLLGSMSLVGPRPHQPREVEAYKETHPQVFTLKPGITGLAQISGRSDLSFEEEITLDTYYIERWSLWLDILVVAKTPFALFRRRRVS